MLDRITTNKTTLNCEAQFVQSCSFLAYWYDKRVFLIILVLFKKNPIFTLELSAVRALMANIFPYVRKSVVPNPHASTQACAEEHGLFYNPGIRRNFPV